MLEQAPRDKVESLVKLAAQQAQHGLGKHGAALGEGQRLPPGGERARWVSIVPSPQHQPRLLSTLDTAAKLREMAKLDEMIS